MVCRYRCIKGGGIMPIFRVVIEVDEPTLEDAEDHIQSLNGTDLVDEIVEVEEIVTPIFSKSEEE